MKAVEGTLADDVGLIFDYEYEGGEEDEEALVHGEDEEYEEHEVIGDCLNLRGNGSSFGHQI